MLHCAGNETQIVCFVISHDQENPSDVIAIGAASAALLISDIPFDNPVAGVRVARIDGAFVVNPTYEETQSSDMSLLMAGTAEGIVMVEAGANELGEDVIMNALEFGHEHIKKIVAAQVELKNKRGKEKVVVAPAEINQELHTKATDSVRPGLETAMQISKKAERF